ncbi:MAG: hypothetical protein KJ851_01775 [Nanoarchaeota archaeon]|nr:hypothetical protein [Nanoarchaeota archaeon]
MKARINGHENPSDFQAISRPRSVKHGASAIESYISSIMEESALIKDSGMLFLEPFAGSLRILQAFRYLTRRP